MQQPYVSVSSRKPAELVGEIIDHAYAEELIQSFKETFPSATSTVFMEASTIWEAVSGLVNVSGIRFMYGMESADDPKSTVVLLIPCNATSTHLAIPNVIAQPNGYLNNRGERIGLKRTFELLYNHAVYYSRLLPEVPFKKIVRGAFFGIQTLRSLLQEYTNAPALQYHFGWDNTVAEAGLRHKPVLQPVHANGAGYEIYLDFGMPCPPACVEPGGDGIIWPITDLLKAGASGPLVEMYFYISPALKEAIYDTGNAREIYAALNQNEIRQCNLLIEESRFEAAKSLFEKVMENLMKTYLYK